MSRLRSWAHDLALGVELGFRGARVRTALTATGIGLAVAVLLFASALPNAINAHNARVDHRAGYDGATYVDSQTGRPEPRPVRPKIFTAPVATAFDGKTISGVLLQPKEPGAPVPPGLDRLPATDEVMVSPALRNLLDEPSSTLLRERLPGRIAGTIAPAGLSGPSELLWYGGSSILKDFPVANGRVTAIDHFGTASGTDYGPLITLLVVMGCVVLLVPIAILVATAARFGSARRDRRLAALRLLGTSRQETLRIAAGEALAGAGAGVVLGALLFAAARALVEHVQFLGFSVYSTDLTPQPVLALGVIVAVLIVSVLVTVFSMRRVAVEPLAVSRRARSTRRRLWWRPIPIVAGFALLVPLLGNTTDAVVAHQWQIAAGGTAVLIGIVALLPWLVEATVTHTRGWSVSSQLALRTLQGDTGSASRIVSGVAVAVAGAIALQMLMASASGGLASGPSRVAPSTADAVVGIVGSVRESRLVKARIDATPGVDGTSMLAIQDLTLRKPGNGMQPMVIVGDCPDLRELATITTCQDGDAFRVIAPPMTYTTNGREYTEATPIPQPGERIKTGPWWGDHSTGWRVPAGAKAVEARPDLGGATRPGIYATPGSLPPGMSEPTELQAYVHLQPGDRAAMERLRTAAWQINPLTDVSGPSTATDDRELASVRRAVLAGAALLLLLIGASLIVTTLEQLGERRRTLATLAAFGTPIGVLRRALLWQTAIPVVLGLAVATVIGTALGAVLLAFAQQSLHMDLLSLAGLLAVGGSMIAAVTLAALPFLNRVAAPAALRSE